MSEQEKKETPQQEAKAEKDEKKAESRPDAAAEKEVKKAKDRKEPPEEKGKAPEAAGEKEAKEDAEKKRAPKISAMTLKEVDAKLKEVQEKMGGFQSGYARQLLAKKAELSGQKAG
ncbi:MAG: hypothetical protein HY587_02915 [Candidatus Omnitrophica bacterium]|nr:hypothetical protein [Candidatus Omnitrophota bacterium]